MELPGEEGAILRPAISVGVEGPRARSSVAPVGYRRPLHNRFGGSIAEIAGIDLTGADRASLAIGGFGTRRDSDGLACGSAKQRGKARYGSVTRGLCPSTRWVRRASFVGFR